MDYTPKHDQALDLPLRFPNDPEPATASAAATAGTTNTTTTATPIAAATPANDSARPRTQKHRDSAQGTETAPAAASASPTFTVYVRVPAPRNGFVDPPDIAWSREKDDALWRSISRMSKNDINWEELAKEFDSTVDFLLIQATILTERHAHQVRAQTRKVVTHAVRDSPPMTGTSPSPAFGSGGLTRFGTGGGSVIGPASTPTSESMGRTLSGRGMTAAAAAAARRRSSAQAMQRTGSAGSGGGKDKGKMASGDVGANEGAGDNAKPESPAATSSSDSDSSSTPSDPVMSRVFKRPPSHLIQKLKRTDAGGGSTVARAGERGTGSILRVGGGLGITSGESDGDEDDDDEAQAAFLPFTSPTMAASDEAKATASPGSSSSRQQQQQHHLQQLQRQRQQPRRHRPVSGGHEGSSPSSSASVSPRTRPFRAPALSSTAGGRHRASSSAGSSMQSTATATGISASASASGSASATAVAAARLQSSRLPGVRSPPGLRSPPPGPMLHGTHHRSAVTAKVMAGLARDGSDTGTTPSMGSSFSDLDDVSLTQSVLDEALASRVEDTVVTMGSDTTDASSAASRRPR